MEKIKAIMSIDAESDGLWGQIFSIGAIVYIDGIYVDSFNYKSNLEPKSGWVVENVLPHLETTPIAGDYKELLREFASFYNEYIEKYDLTVLWHRGHVVESHLFRELVSNKLIGEWDAPYTPIEVSEVLRIKGFAPDSVDNYAKQHNVGITQGYTHNPLYDCEVAAKVYFTLTK